MEHSELYASAYYEAGHAVIAMHLGLGLPETGLSVVPSDDVSEVVSIERDHSDSPGTSLNHNKRQRIESRVMETLAGTAAQRYFRYLPTNPVHGEQDQGKALDLLFLISGSNEEREAYLMWLTVRVQDMLTMPAVCCQIIAVADALLERKSLTAREVRKVSLRALGRASLQPATGGADHRMEQHRGG